MSQLKVNAIRHTGASSDAVTLASDGSCTVKATNNLSNRRLTINGDMRIAQRSTAAVNDDSYRTVDRFSMTYSGTDNHPTQERHALTSSDTGPWEKGFRYSYHITNADQTSGAGASDYIRIGHAIEAQDIANSGWNYTSASSYITFQFWIKSSVAQSFKVEFYAHDGTAQGFSFDTGSLSANTWTKVTKTIPGNSNLTFDNDSGEGLHIRLFAFQGTDKTDNSVTEDAWAAFSGSARTKDMASTWYTTNNATLEITGVQLEVGDYPSSFEFRLYGDELLRCQRYFYMHVSGDEGSVDTNYTPIGIGYYDTASHFYTHVFYGTTMRTNPDLYKVEDTGYWNIRDTSSSETCNSVQVSRLNTRGAVLLFTGNVAGTQHAGSMVRTHNVAAVRLGFDAEL